MPHQTSPYPSVNVVTLFSLISNFGEASGPAMCMVPPSSLMQSYHGDGGSLAACCLIGALLIKFFSEFFNCGFLYNLAVT
jgi:hypothetical protein